MGQPGRPGYAAHTSERALPYVAVPTCVPSTKTVTELTAYGPTAEVLSIAHPPIPTVPLKVAPDAGASIYTEGSVVLGTVKLTWLDPLLPEPVSVPYRAMR